eukprot:gene14942-16632_t
MVNSSWTSNHIASLWRLPPTTKPSKLLPTNQLSTSSPPSKEKEKTEQRAGADLPSVQHSSTTGEHRSSETCEILPRPRHSHTTVSQGGGEGAGLGQFRPEKDHLLQIEIMHEIKRRNETSSSPLSLTLLMFGSIRNEEDERYVQQLQAKIDSLALQSTVKICTNQSYDVIQFFLSIAVMCDLRHVLR